MKLPAPSEYMREALVVVGGALLAAFIVGQMPIVREWIKRQWDSASRP